LPPGAVMCGIFRGPDHEPTPVVFNTGQVILGWTRAYIETKQDRYVAASRRAGDWLVREQSPDGSAVRGAGLRSPSTPTVHVKSACRLARGCRETRKSTRATDRRFLISERSLR